ncbi:hypothetical protein PR048_008523 [Dryococelus australis]|uniref:Uncharacterized protein n=1 Tax=Dryococelus australis TaxID=614101 RepID=A0ABQ9HY61_9NEOP|nr:hypothetical protein PR048_008523 [Dryococelus australis]
MSGVVINYCRHACLIILARSFDEVGDHLGPDRFSKVGDQQHEGAGTGRNIPAHSVPFPGLSVTTSVPFTTQEPVKAHPAEDRLRLGTFVVFLSMSSWITLVTVPSRTLVPWGEWEGSELRYSPHYFDTTPMDFPVCFNINNAINVNTHTTRVPPKRIVFDPRRVHPDFRTWERGGRGRWSVGFLGVLQYPLPLRSAATPSTPHFPLADFLYLTVKGYSFFDWLKHVLVPVNCMRMNDECTVSELRNPEWLGKIRRHQQPLQVGFVFSHVGIAPEDADGRWVFSGISRFSRPCIRALLHTHPASPSSTPKTSMSRAGQISLLNAADHSLRITDSSTHPADVCETADSARNSTRGLSSPHATLTPLPLLGDMPRRLPGTIDPPSGRVAMDTTTHDALPESDVCLQDRLAIAVTRDGNNSGTLGAIQEKNELLGCFLNMIYQNYRHHRGPVARAIPSGAAVAQWLERSQTGITILPHTGRQTDEDIHSPVDTYPSKVTKLKQEHSGPHPRLTQLAQVCSAANLICESTQTTSYGNLVPRACDSAASGVIRKIVSQDRHMNKVMRPMAMLILHKVEKYTTCKQVDLKQGSQKCSFYRVQPIINFYVGAHFCGCGKSGIRFSISQYEVRNLWELYLAVKQRCQENNRDKYPQDHPLLVGVRGRNTGTGGRTSVLPMDLFAYRDVIFLSLPEISVPEHRSCVVLLGNYRRLPKRSPVAADPTRVCAAPTQGHTTVVVVQAVNTKMSTF